METECSLEPAYGCFAQGWQLAEEGDEGQYGEDQDGGENILEGSHRVFVILIMFMPT